MSEEALHDTTDATPAPAVRERALCYIVDGGRLLVFRHVDYDWERVGVQVPAGGVEPGEDPAAAALREATEETGLTGLRVVEKIGRFDYDAAPYVDQIHRNHVYRLELTEPAPERWRSREEHDGVGEPTEFECFWIPLADAHVLMAGQGALIGHMTRHL